MGSTRSPLLSLLQLLLTTTPLLQLLPQLTLTIMELSLQLTPMEPSLQLTPMELLTPSTMELFQLLTPTTMAITLVSLLWLKTSREENQTRRNCDKENTSNVTT